MANKRTVHVIVLGDLSRSPRILSQAHFLARAGWYVTLSGYNSGSVSLFNPSLRALDIPACPDFKKLHFPSFLSFFLKFIFTALALFCHLVRHCRSDLILIQNPPAVPTFIVVWVFIKITSKS
ncbi:unnamed protein product [Heterobilharzia americana]|nr:unnamed protein product [Heterobilharzia americana]